MTQCASLCLTVCCSTEDGGVQACEVCAQLIVGRIFSSSAFRCMNFGTALLLLSRRESVVPGIAMVS